MSGLIAFKDGALDGTNILVTGSAGHLGEALMCGLSQAGHQPIGLDIKASVLPTEIGSITDRRFVNRFMRMHVVFHTATDWNR